jgi:hypothetical protein
VAKRLSFRHHSEVGIAVTPDFGSSCIGFSQLTQHPLLLKPVFGASKSGKEPDFQKNLEKSKTISAAKAPFSTPF